MCLDKPWLVLNIMIVHSDMCHVNKAIELNTFYNYTQPTIRGDSSVIVMRIIYFPLTTEAPPGEQVESSPASCRLERPLSVQVGQ